MAGGLGKLIVQRRRDLGFSQQELARKLGVPAANLSQLELSATRWRSRLIPALANALQVSQLEIALAAGIIEGLPPFPTPDNSVGSEYPLYPALANEPAQREGAEVQLCRMASDLTPSEIEFLLVVAGTLLERRQQAEESPNPGRHIGALAERSQLVEMNF
jgi:transcriptional regulator with XRE-family HTH domain